MPPNASHPAHSTVDSALRVFTHDTYVVFVFSRCGTDGYGSNLDEWQDVLPGTESVVRRLRGCGPLGLGRVNGIHVAVADASVDSDR
jgi:hypothetical protein